MLYDPQTDRLVRENVGHEHCQSRERCSIDLCHLEVRTFDQKDQILLLHLGRDLLHVPKRKSGADSRQSWLLHELSEGKRSQED
jgi:hypothetical protein